jgi:hypothetical protein
LDNPVAIRAEQRLNRYTAQACRFSERRDPLKLDLGEGVLGGQGHGFQASTYVAREFVLPMSEGYASIADCHSAFPGSPKIPKTPNLD